MRADRERDYVEYVSARLALLHRAAYLLCGDADLADDLVQVTITKLYRRWHRASQADNLDAYVQRMLIHAFIDEKRLAWSRVRLMSAPPEGRVDPARRGARPQAAVEDRQAVVAALRHLPPRQRAVLVLRYLCDRPVEEVAQIIGCSPGSVKSQTSRGLVALRGLFAGAAVTRVAAPVVRNGLPRP